MKEQSDYVTVTKSNISINYRRKQYKFPTRAIQSLEMLERRFYFYDGLRCLLLIFLVPLLLYHDRIEPLIIPVYSIALFFSLFFKYHQRKFMLYLLLKDGNEIIISVRPSDHPYFIESVSRIQDAIYHQLLFVKSSEEVEYFEDVPLA